MPNEKMEILRKPEINNMIAETCTRQGGRAGQRQTKRRPETLAMLMASALNEYLAKQTEIFTKIVKENAEKINKKQRNYPSSPTNTKSLKTYTPLSRDKNSWKSYVRYVSGVRVK